MIFFVLFQFYQAWFLQRLSILGLFSLNLFLVSEREEIVWLQPVKFVDSPLLRLDIILFFKSLIYNMTLFVDEMLLLLRGLLEAVVDLGQNLKLVV